MSDDLISRQAAIDVVMKCYFNDDLFEAYEYELNELPSAQPHTGTWQDRYGMFACSECGREYIQRHHYCPHCGTKMLRENEG